MHYRRVHDSDPLQFGALCGAGLLYAQPGDPDRALQCFTGGCRARPWAFISHFNRGVAPQWRGHHEATLASDGQARSLQPDFAEAYFRRGNVLNRPDTWSAMLNTSTTDRRSDDAAPP